jgi:nucleotide-binding universal stress UspA family protein
MKLSEPVKSIVACIDGSTAAINAAHWAVDEAISRDIPLRLVQVVGADDASSTAGADDHLET